MIEFSASPTRSRPIALRTGASAVATGLATCALLFASLIPAMASAQSVFVKYEGAEVTWSNTKLGGGPLQPNGWIEVNVGSGFTGDIYAADFLSASAVTVYGTYQNMTWGPEDLLGSSKVSFVNGGFDDINLAFYDAQTQRTLIISGPPTANALIVNSPKPPCTSWPGFAQLNFCGARIAIDVTTSSTMPTLSSNVTIPPTPSPVSGGTHAEGISGFVEYNEAGGLSFGGPYSGLNSFGPFLLTSALNWSLLQVNVPHPWAKRIWFSNVVVDHTGTAQTQGGAPVPVGDENYWVLAGEETSWVQARRATLENISAFCGQLALLGVGVCDLNVNWFLTAGDVGFGLRASAPNLGENFILDIDAILELAQLSSSFTGSITQKIVTVPVLEQ